VPDSRPSLGLVATVVVALAIGLAFGFIDSRPTFDDTAVIAVALVGGAALVAAIYGRYPWLWALLIGLPIPLVEVPLTGSTASAAALLFATFGAGLGWVAGRAARTAIGSAAPQSGEPRP
jgi:hypothetical protein